MALFKLSVAFLDLFRHTLNFTSVLLSKFFLLLKFGDVPLDACE